MKYEIERAAVTLSVTELCALALTAGDLDLRPGMMRRFTPQRAQIGIKAHRALQKAADVRYDAEVLLSNTTLYHNISFEIDGRADGILYTDPLTVDEIKTVSGKSFDRPPAPIHLTQVKCYAYMLCRERGLEQVTTRLTYYRTEDGAIKYFSQTHKMEELRTFYFDLLSRIEYRARILIERQTERLPSVKSGMFPYASVREGQDIMIRECYRDIRAGKRLFIEAPTGTGKTLSSLYPAVRALGDGYADRIFYLTAKASVRREAYRAAAQIFEAGSRLRTVVLTAREQLCRCDAAKSDPLGISHHCNPADCPYAKGFYDRCGSAVCDALSGKNGFSRIAVLEYAEKYVICPYEFQLELSEFCDIVICDYNYAFDPMVYLRRFFDPDATVQSRSVFLVDEAHNLADRASAMYSAELNSRDIVALWRILPEGDVGLRERLEELSVTMQGFRRLCRDTLTSDEDGREHGYEVRRDAMEDFCKLVLETRGALEARLRAYRGDEFERDIHALLGSLKRFYTISEYYDEHFLTFLEVDGEDCIVRLLCQDPSRILDSCLSRAHASVMFSATLTPLDYFADILGGGKGAVQISLPSPFASEHACPIAVPVVSTRYEDRAKSYKKIASLIAASVSGRAGNYIAYFPSYDYMQAVLKHFSERYPKVHTAVQERGMNATDRERFLAAFCDDGMLRVGFCVLGGSFSEGIDLPGGKLIGAIVVGTGLPGITSERNILRDYYEHTRERGYDYAYTYPGMNRVLQAAGRVIRTEEDRGVIVLIDDRYGTERYKMLFPEHWHHMQYAGNSSELAEMVSDFWRQGAQK